MEVDIKIASVLESIILGYHSVQEFSGGWVITQIGDDQVSFEYFEEDLLAVYDFFIKLDPEITFYNSHRQAARGYGTPTLQTLESAFGELSIMRQMSVVVEFDLFGQETTERWLKKNNYTCGDDGLYRKVFESVSES